MNPIPTSNIQFYTSVTKGHRVLKRKKKAKKTTHIKAFSPSNARIALDC